MCLLQFRLSDAASQNQKLKRQLAEKEDQAESASIKLDQLRREFSKLEKSKKKVK